MVSWRRLGIATLAGLSFFTVGCASNFTEQHFFQVLAEGEDGNRRPVNFFRLKIDGYTAFSTARYVSGYYDERAVDLFFDGGGVHESDPNKIGKIFRDGLKNPGKSNETIAPLTPANQDGKLVMILSTNANAVAGAIGEFAESREVAAALTNLVNRREILDSRRAVAEQGVRSAKAAAILQDLESLFLDIQANESEFAGDKERLELAYLRILSSIANAMRGDGSIVFSKFEEARIWFETAAQGG